LQDPGKIDLWHKYEVAELFDSTLKKMRGVGNEDDKRTEVNNFSRERCQSQGTKRVFFDQAYELLILQIEQQHLDTMNAVPFGPCSDEDDLIQEFKANARKLKKWKLVYQHALGQDQVPVMPKAADRKGYDPIPEYDDIVTAYDIGVQKLKELPDWDTDKYAKLRSLVQETTKSKRQTDNLRSRIDVLQLVRKKQSDALAGFQTVTTQNFEYLADQEDIVEWLQELAPTFDDDTPYLKDAREKLDLVRRYAYLLDQILADPPELGYSFQQIVRTIAKEDHRILIVLLSHDGVSEKYKQLIRDTLK
jgi:hypothetical protein